MNKFKLIFIIITLVFGIAIISSYIPIIHMQIKKNNLWFGINGMTRHYFYTCMILSIIGFCLFFFTYIENMNKSQYINNQIGIFKNKLVLPIILFILLFFSLLWSFLMLNKNKVNIILASICLSITAVCTVLLIAGTSEVNIMDSNTLKMLVGLVLFSLTTVINDGIIYNSRMLVSFFK